jgi:hypothetical protein
MDNFEPTSSFAYRFARYTAIPDILQMSEVTGGEPFLLRELTFRIIDKYLTKEQQAIRVPFKESEGTDSMRSYIRYYVAFISKETGTLTNIGRGMFRLPDETDIDESQIRDEAVEEGGEEADEFNGWIYAFTFFALQRDGRHPIKVGKTTGDVDARVADQCRTSMAFDNPVVVGRWKVERVGPTELAIHNVLKARGQWRENAPGREWFDTTVAEVEAILKFINT